jgi:hypothetical protein
LINRYRELSGRRGGVRLKVYLAEPVREEIQSMELEERRELLRALRVELIEGPQYKYKPDANGYRCCDVIGYRCTYRDCNDEECTKFDVEEGYMVLDIKRLWKLGEDGLSST